MITIRPPGPDDVGAMGEVFARTYREAHRGQVPEHLLRQRTSEASAAGWDRTLRALASEPDPDERVWIAVDASGTIVGLAMGGEARPWPDDETARRARRTGECWLLYVDPRRQRSGAGRALLGALAAWLAGRGRERLVIGVLAANGPARAFYERVGGVLLGSRDHVDDDVVLDEVVYVWDDLTTLAPADPPDVDNPR